ncbi:MAG: polysaccharide deacetylase family protein, partial [Candidatus Norongarragalinales archaeon]
CESVSKHSLKEEGGEGEAFFDATHAGLLGLLEILKDECVPATFFFEAAAAREIDARERKKNKGRKKENAGLAALIPMNCEVAAHGFNHEDFTGSLTGVIIPRAKKKAILRKTKAELEKIFPQRRVEGFRAPYLNWNDDLLALLGETGFVYDSSAYSRAPRVEKKRGVFEVPLTEGVDANGKRMVSYLWPLMEGSRTAADYEDFVFRALSQSDFVVFATHSWHSHASIEGPRAESDIELRLRVLRQLVQSFKEAGDFVTAREVVFSKRS